VPDQLTQDEIDALIRASLGGEDSAETPAKSKQDIKYKPYDFKNPKIFSKEQIQTISRIYDTYAKHLASYMSGVLRTECSITVNTIEEQRYFEYGNALPESIMMGVLEVKPLEGNMLIEINRSTCYLIIERLLGGTGEVPVVQNEFTDIELGQMNKFYRHIARFLKETWSNIADMEPRLDRLETNARLTQIMPLNEIVLIVLLSVKIKDHEGPMSICIPCINLDSILANAENHVMLSRKRKNADADKTKVNILENIKTSKLDVRGILGSTTLTLQEVSQLQVGDVIPIDKPVGSPVVLRVGSIDWFDGEIGIKRNKMAVKIKNVLRKIR